MNNLNGANRRLSKIEHAHGRARALKFLHLLERMRNVLYAGDPEQIAELKAMLTRLGVLK